MGMDGCGSATMPKPTQALHAGSKYRTHTLTLWQLGRMSRPKWKLVPVKEVGCSPNSGARDAEMTGGRHLGQEKCIYIYIYIKIKFDCKQSKE